MQNDAPAAAAEPSSLAVIPIAGTLEPNSSTSKLSADEFHRVMNKLEELKEKPLFSEDELEEATEEDDLFDDEDYDLEEVIRRQKQKLEESRRKAGIVDEEDDDYYDDYSAEMDDEERRAREKLLASVTGSADGSPGKPDPEKEERAMQDYLSTIRSKSTPHRFKSNFEDFDNGGADGELLSGGMGHRKLRKNDSIKIISTPNGKVGIVYKVEAKANDNETATKGGPRLEGGANGATGTEQRQNKITPVITADGKVALLYRGASDNGDTFRNKYEPITAKDILQLIDNNNNSNGSSPTTSPSGSADSNTNSSIKNITNNNIYNSHNNYDNSYGTFNRNINNNVIVDSDRSVGAAVESQESSGANGRAEVVTVAHTRATTPMARLTSSTEPPASSPVAVEETAGGGWFGSIDPYVPGSGSDRQENTLLINRPLSEVLGIRKNQYAEGNTIKIPNMETSTNKMRITHGNNLLSSLLHNLQHGLSSSNGTNAGGSGDHLDNRHHAEEDRRRAGYSVNGFSRSRFYINRRTTPALPPRVIKEEESEEDTFAGVDDNTLPEVINLAIIPAFEHEIDEKYIRANNRGEYHRRHHRHQYNVAPGQPAVHCAMQALVACAVLATFFGIVGTYFKVRVVDHIRVLYW